MELCFNEMTVMKNGALPEDIALCAQAGFSAVELSALRGDRLFMVHVSDCPARAPFTAQRAESYWPGEGDAPLEELLRSVRAIGYDGPCSVEVMDPNVLALPAEEAIRRAAETMKPLLARVER
jgi:hypothetical protein